MLIPLGVLAAAGAGGLEDYQLIAYASGTGSSPTISFTGIPQDYAHLQIRAVTRVTSTTFGTYYVLARYNDFSTSTQTQQILGHTQGGELTDFNLNLNYQRLGITNDSSSNWDTGQHSSGLIEIYNYSSTTKQKTTRIISGQKRPNNGNLQLALAHYPQTTAITSISLTAPAGNWTASTRFGLYGIRGANV